MKFETYAKNNDGKFTFIGWNDINRDEEFCIETKKTKKFIYKTYKWLNGKTDILRFTI